MAILAGRDWGNPLINALRSPENILGMVGAPNPFVSAGVIPRTGLTAGTKIALGAGIGAGAGLLYLAGKGGIGQTATQTGMATAPTNYNFYQTKGGGAQNITSPSGGTATTDQTQTQQATSFDGNLLIIGIIAIGALMLFTRGKK